VAKIPTGGSSIGVEMAASQAELQSILQRFFQDCKSVLVERRVAGPEFSCGVLEQAGGPFALPVTQIIPQLATFFDFNSKYKNGGAREITPAPIPEVLAKKIQAYSAAIFTALGCSGYCRSDFILEEGTGEVFLLEVNTLPGFTTASIFPKQAASAGISFSELLEILVNLALSRQKK
jgi:D-alanine-D-alanine ligase